MDELNFELPLKLIIQKQKSISLILVGCGGTGSWLAPAVARVGKILIERFSTEVKIFFVDPDRVEEKNIYRQNFCEAEIGEYKADTLAARFGMAWGLEIHAISKKYINAASGFHGCDGVIIGCVDTPGARKQIADSLQNQFSTIWLDCGNSESYGQVLCGVNSPTPDLFEIPGYCSGLPMPHVQHPELVKNHEAEPIFEQPLSPFSCADQAMRDSQGLAINQRMAAEAADYLVRMLITRDLKKFATYVDLESGTTRSKYITEEAIKAYGK